MEDGGPFAGREDYQDHLENYWCDGIMDVK